jgi:hypothetical protein
MACATAPGSRSPFVDKAAARTDLKKISQEIRSQFLPPDQSIKADPVKITGAILSIISKIPGTGPVGGGLGVLGGALTLSGALSTDTGAPILGAVDAKASQLGDIVDTRYTAAAAAFTQVGLMIVSDCGKLIRVGASSALGPAKVATREWRWPADDALVRASVRTAAKRWFLRADAGRMVALGPPRRRERPKLVLQCVPAENQLWLRTCKRRRPVHRADRVLAVRDTAGHRACAGYRDEVHAA